jgi:hypothetical protein
MARYAVQMKAELEGKVVVELGCGCGLPGLAAGNDYCLYCANWLMSVTFSFSPSYSCLLQPEENVLN